MSHARSPASRRRQRTPRLVRPLARARDRVERLSEEEAGGYFTGLRAAHLLKLHFPAFFAEHVATKSITPERMLGVLHAFLELAHRDLLRLELGWDIQIDIREDADPVEVIDCYIDHGGILQVLFDQLHWLLTAPPIEVFGLPRDSLADSWRRGQHLLSLVLLRLLDQTGWGIGIHDVSVLRMESDAAVQAMRSIRRLKPLPKNTPESIVASTCAWSCNLPGFPETTWQLGELLPYVAHMTGNTYADLALEECEPGEHPDTYGIWDSVEQLARQRELQQAAARLEQLYTALDQQIVAKPALIGLMAKALHADAEAAIEACKTPTSLVELLEPRWAELEAIEVPL